MIRKLGLTRNVIRPDYALITPDGHVPSVLPGWTGCTAYVLMSAAIGAASSQSLSALNRESKGRGATECGGWFICVVTARTHTTGTSLTPACFAYLPPGTE